MYIETVPNRNARPAILLREGWREGSKVCKRTLANLSDWPAAKIAALRRVLRDEPLIASCSKLATTRAWQATTLGETWAVADADEDALYAALDWLGARQARVEAKLAARHLDAGAQVLYDVSSSYFEGHSRDGKRGRPIVVYGVLSDVDGRPVSVDVYPGNTGGPSTVAD
jgi:hypothetical protein